MVFSLFLLLPLFSLSADSQQVMTDANEERQTSERTSFKIGDRIKVIVETMNGNSVVGYARYYPKVDEFSMLQVPGDGFARNENAQVRITVGDLTSRPAPVRKAGYIAEYLSFLIYIDEGAHTGVGWDNSFDTNSCKIRDGIINNTCGKTYSNDLENVDIKIFLGFVGNDRDSTSFNSAQSMPSTFLRFGAGGVVDDVTDFVDDSINWFDDLF